MTQINFLFIYFVLYTNLSFPSFLSCSPHLPHIRVLERVRSPLGSQQVYPIHSLRQDQPPPTTTLLPSLSKVFLHRKLAPQSYFMHQGQVLFPLPVAPQTVQTTPLFLVFKGPSSILCRFPICQSRDSELATSSSGQLILWVFLSCSCPLCTSVSVCFWIRVLASLELWTIGCLSLLYI